MMQIESRCTVDVGKQFGKLTLLDVSRVRIHRRVAGRFVCTCGRMCSRPIDRVKNGRVTHCGCATNRRTNVRHGMRNSGEYRSWISMKDRCLNPRSKDYAGWGGAGVTIHRAWIDSFESFYECVGPRPAGATLDRIDTRLGYTPENVRWATPFKQAANRRNGWTVEIQGRRYDSVEAAARASGVSAMTIVRWCDGYTDPRRSSAVKPARDGCRRWRTYK